MKKQINIMDTELLFIAMSALLTGGLAINAQISSKNKEKRLSEKTEEIVQLQKKLNSNSERLIGVQNELLQYTTGGDSFGEVEILKIDNGKGNKNYIFYYSNKGKYPLYDVIITLLDRNSIDKKRLKKNEGVATVEDLKKYKTEKLENITAFGGRTFYSVLLLRDGIINDFLFTIDTKNGKFYQELKFVEKNGELLTATKLTKHDLRTGDSEILIDRADEKFPGSKEGKIEW